MFIATDTETAAAAVDRMIRDILRREGGYVDDPLDPGGATNHGVSLRYARGIGLDLDGDGDTDADDIRLVTPAVAAQLYHDDFYSGPRINRLPAPIQPVVFDWAVNSGPPRAIIGLQGVLNEAYWVDPGLGLAPLDEDGVIGPLTRRAAGAASEALGPVLVNALVDARIAFYHDIVTARPASRRFLRGWLRRAEEFRV